MIYIHSNLGLDEFENAAHVPQNIDVFLDADEKRRSIELVETTKRRAASLCKAAIDVKLTAEKFRPPPANREMGAVIEAAVPA